MLFTKMERLLFVMSVIVVIMQDTIVTGEIRKSWNSPGPNFESAIPSFTPFKNAELAAVEGKSDQKEPHRIEWIGPSLANSVEVPTRDSLYPLVKYVAGFIQNYKDSAEQLAAKRAATTTTSTTTSTTTTVIPITDRPLQNAIQSKIVDDHFYDDMVSSATLEELESVVVDEETENMIPFSPPESLFEDENVKKYNIGPGVNLSLDLGQEMVSVNLDEDCLKDIFTGRGKKNDLIAKILPLFILPFLMQSAVVPFVLSTLKLLLFKSILVGKVAILLLLVSAFKNHTKGGHDSPYYVEPYRRSEFNGYQAEGRPTTWVN